MRTGHAPGKVILLGEHAVVFGETALAAALPFGVTVNAEPRSSGGLELHSADAPADDPRVREAVALLARELGVEHARIDVETRLPVGGGLGSSAAFAVALCRALSPQPLPVEELNRIAMLSERLFHGTPSGVDNAVVCHGGIVRFRRGPPAETRRLQPARPLPLVVALTGRSRRTSGAVASLRQRVEADPTRWTPVVQRLGTLAEEGAVAVESGDLAGLGARMDEAHALLASCELSCPELEAIVTAARGAGALGAKLTGAGGGGSAVVLAPDPAPVAAAIAAAGFVTRIVSVDGVTAAADR